MTRVSIGVMRKKLKLGETFRTFMGEPHWKRKGPTRQPAPLAKLGMGQKKLGMEKKT